jgi:hypothetical protein
MMTRASLGRVDLQPDPGPVDRDVEPEEAAAVEVSGREVGDLGRQRDIVVATQPDTAADRLLADAVNAEISRIPILPAKSFASRVGP